MNRSGAKTLFYTVAFLTVLMVWALNGFADMAAVEINPDVEKEMLLLKRDNLNDAIDEYGAKIEAIDGFLLNLKMDQEWLDLKFLDIQAQDRPIPQELIESRNLMVEKQSSAIKERESLLEQIQAHTLTLKKLEIPMGQKRIQSKNLFETGEELPGNTDFVEDDLVSLDLEKELTTKINAMGIRDWVELANNNSGLRLEVQLPILFAPGRSTIIGSYEGFLEKIATLVKPYEVFVHVNGVTDGAKSKKISNIDLGARRATAIVNRLVKYGLPPSIFKITSRGEYSEGSHMKVNSPSLNRRAEITVYFSHTG
ncbi:putative chemotaxis protein [Desulforapulum autotrophicum HRM2]|uniref:Chemotaxis protein n=1 Tax=Desulforapulum autotrophicum (strain ATCC 43914 / DSM 3382 / VKM B-1955 / HRM2) TaxID=177437 RepID=C0QG47_DESAH|nr:OmpA family protein [Desulforapulum autotrophicum]ACN17626.1 putative chemotaxis protein [Desulforapulum autotrophicum HRM2]